MTSDTGHLSNKKARDRYSENKKSELVFNIFGTTDPDRNYARSVIVNIKILKNNNNFAIMWFVLQNQVFCFNLVLNMIPEC